MDIGNYVSNVLINRSQVIWNYEGCIRGQAGDSFTGDTTLSLWNFVR